MCADASSIGTNTINKKRAKSDLRLLMLCVRPPDFLISVAKLNINFQITRLYAFFYANMCEKRPKEQADM